MQALINYSFLYNKLSERERERDKQKCINIKWVKHPCRIEEIYSFLAIRLTIGKVMFMLIHVHYFVDVATRTRAFISEVVVK